MAPTFRIYTKKKWGGYEWGNTYYANAFDEADARDIGQSIANLERSITWNGVQFTGVRISTFTQDGRTGRTYASAGYGDLPLPNVLPPEVCVRVQLLPGFKQSSVKFYRFCMRGIGQNAGLIAGDDYSTLVTFATALIAINNLCDSNGGSIQGVTVDTELANHQLYRKWAARAGVDEGD